MRDQLRIGQAAIWLALFESNLAVVGVLILVAASFIEHTMAVALGRKETVSAWAILDI
jgi:hypothetical protein